MGVGRPVIASRIGGLPFTVIDGVTGLLFEPGDVADLANQIETLLNDPTLQQRLGAAGRQRFEQHFTWDVMLRKHYLPLLTSPQRAPVVESCPPPETVRPKVAIIFDNQSRPETTGVYCRRALGQIAEVEHFLPGEISRIPRHGFDLYLVIDDGLRTPWPADLHPCAWWAIDTHLDPDWYRTQGRSFDFVFAAQQDGAEQLRAAGIGSATWLPLACDPEFQRPHAVEKQTEVAFVGNLIPGPRAELVDLIHQHYPSSFIGKCYFKDMATTYSAARIVFNRSVKNDVNMRVFEALAWRDEKFFVCLLSIRELLFQLLQVKAQQILDMHGFSMESKVG